MTSADERPNVVLTGFMGTGKSTCGRQLADILNYELVDTDHLIEAEHGSIPEIFRNQGEAAFREYERVVAARLADRRGLVIATGGRLMLDAVNADLLSASGRVFCLTASVETILARLLANSDGDERPLLAGTDVAERITTMLAERAPAYAAFEAVDTEGRSPHQIAKQIATELDGIAT